MLNSRNSYFQSTEGYKYHLNGWYDAHYLVPLGRRGYHDTPDTSNEIRGEEEEETAVSPKILSSWVEAMEQDTSPCEVRYLCYTFHPWFPFPFPFSFPYLTLPERNRCYSLYLCHRCLTPFFSKTHLTVHLDGYCQMYQPPGEVLYYNPSSMQKVFYVDGAKHLHYGRCVSLLGKQFIESKLLGNDADLYEFFMTTIPVHQLPLLPQQDGCESHHDTAAAASKSDFTATALHYDKEKWSGDVVVGYFSRLKHSPNTLSCIVTLPPFQQWRLGSFLLDVSYFLTSVRQSTCGCERCGSEGGRISRPFSPHGQLALMAYWFRSLRRAIMTVVRASGEQQSISVESWAALRALMDIPIHMDDLQFLIVNHECAFYSHSSSSAATDMTAGEAPEMLHTSSVSRSSSALAGALFLEEEEDASSGISEGFRQRSEFTFSKKYLLRDHTGALLYGKRFFHY